MPRMAVLVAVQDGSVTRLCGIKRDGEDYCSCFVDWRDPRRCAHLWALTCVLQSQRPKAIKQLLSPQVMSRTSSPIPSAPPSVVFRAPSPLQVTPLSRPVPTCAPSCHPIDPCGLGIVDLLARSRSFVQAFRGMFEIDEIETLTVSVLAQLFSNVEQGLVGDYWNVLAALKGELTSTDSADISRPHPARPRPATRTHRPPAPRRATLRRRIVRLPPRAPTMEHRSLRPLCAMQSPVMGA